MLSTGEREPWFDSAKKVLFVYLLLSLTWIVVTDRLLASLIQDKELNLSLQTYKGWLYVLVVGIFIYIEKIMAQNKVRASEMRYQNVIENTGAAYFRLDNKGNLVDVNDAWLKMYKYQNVNEVIGKSFEVFQIPGTIVRAKEIIKEIMSGKKLSGEFSRLNKDGTVGYFNFSTSPIYEENKIVGIEGFMVDVTEKYQYEEELKEREKKFRSLFENMVEGVAIHEVIFSDDGKPINYRLINLNSAYEKHTGIKIKEAKGKLATEVYGTDEPPYLKEFYGVVKNQKPYTFETHFEPLKRYFYVSVFPLDKKHFVTVFQDITDRKRFESEIIALNTKTLIEKRKFETVVNEMADAVVVIDKNHVITVVNKTLEEISGYKASELTGKRFDDVLNFVYEKSGELIKNIPGPIFSSGGVIRPKEEVDLIKKDGKKVAVDVVASPLKNEIGEVIGVVGIMRDVTKQRVLDKLKTDFVSMASHQLRTPLTGIKWFAELMSDQVGKLSESELTKYVNSIKESNERMIDLVDDMLNTSRIESGKRPKEDMVEKSVKEIFELVAKDQDKLLRDMNIKMVGLDSIDPDIKLYGILSEYLQIFGNIVNNAAKYSPKNSEIEIGVTKKDKMIEVTVSDKGVGIPSEQVDRLFEKFFRADNVAKRIAGSGLGLYVVKGLIDNYKGRIRIESKEGVGTKVYVQLPFIIK